MLTFKARVFAALLIAVFVYFAPIIPGIQSQAFNRLPFDPPFWVECNDLSLVQLYPVCLAALINRNSPVVYGTAQAFSLAAPFVIALVVFSVSQSIFSVWLARIVSFRTRGSFRPGPSVRRTRVRRWSSARRTSRTASRSTRTRSG